MSQAAPPGNVGDLAANARRAQAAFEQAAVGVAIVAPDGRWLDVNPRLCEIVGYSEEALLQLTFADITHPEDMEADLALVGQALAGEIQSYILNKRYIRKDGSIVPIKLTVSLVRDADGKPEHFISIVEDDTQRQQAEEALMQSEALYRSLIATMEEGIVVHGADLQIIAFNASALRILGLSEDQLRGRTPLDPLWHTIHEDGSPFPGEAHPATVSLRNGESFSNVIMGVQRVDGALVWLSVNAQPLMREGQSRPIGAVASFTDVTQNRQADVLLHTSQKRLNEAQRIAQVGSWELDLLSGSLLWSDEIFRIFEIDQARFGASYEAFLNAIHPDDREKVNQAYTHSVANRVPYEIAHRLRLPDGRIKWVNERCETFYDEQGKPIRSIGTVQDISARKETETEFHTILQTTPDGYWLVSPQDGSLLDVNEAYCSMSGYTREELLAMRIPDLEAVETPEETRRHLEAVMQGKQGRFDTSHRRKDGSIIHMDVSVKYIDTRGGVIVALLRDITERKLQERELMRYREHLEELVQERSGMLQEAQRIAHMGNWKWDVASGEITWSDEIYRIFGYAPGEFVPTYERFLATLHPDDVQRIKQSEQEAFARGNHHSIDHRILLPNGETRWVHEEAVASVDESGKAISLTGTVQDITERKQTEQALIQAKDQAEEASRAKSEFLSRMSHELRTPMNAILGFSQVLEMEQITPEQLDFVREIHQAGSHLLELINELLDLSRIEAGKFPIAIQPAKIGVISEQAMQWVKSLFQKKNVTITNECDSDIAVLTDSTRLKQILVNLLTNAAKYNHAGGSVRIGCELLDEERLRLFVTDTGPGIAAEKLDQIFMPFERLGAEFTDVEGTGIGLALSKHMAEMMGAELGVDSTPGQGSTFWIDLPRAHVTETSSDILHDLAKAAAKPMKILYIEDNAANLKVVETIFRRQPELTLISATNGEYGLELARSYHPEVILLDIHLPGLDGFAVLKELQARAETRDIPVIALSADAMHLDVEKGLAAGFRHYLTKPIQVQVLLDVVNKIVTAAA